MKLFCYLILLIKLIYCNNQKINFTNWNKFFNLYNKITVRNNYSSNSEMESLLRNKTIFCVNDCSNNGFCLDGKCYCIPEFFGEDCSKSNKKCINNCSEKGECVNGICKCKENYAGLDCSLSNNQI